MNTNTNSPLDSQNPLATQENELALEAHIHRPDFVDPSHSVIEPPENELDERAELNARAEFAANLGSEPQFSASERMTSGVSWSTLAVVFNQFLFLIRSIALARLLSQDNFGLMGMSLTVHGAFAAFTNFGLTNIIVAGKFDSDEQLKSQLNTIWTIELLRRIAATLLIISLSYPIAKFYGDPRLTSILTITCLTLAINGFENVGLKMLEREVKWKQATIYKMVGTALVTLTVIIVAFWRRDVWSLAWGQFAAGIVSVALSYFYHPYRPRFQLDRAAVKRSAKMGPWFMVIGIMVYITTTVDNVFVGKLLGSSALGVYVIAYTISSIPQSIISKVISGVLFPIVAALNRNDDERLGPAIGRVLNVSTSVLALIMVPMAVLAPELVRTFYGPKWVDAIVPLQILLLPGLFRGLLQNIGPIMLGLDRPDLEARSKIAEAILFVVALWFLVPKYGIVGAACASALAYFLAVVVRYRNAVKLVPAGFRDLPIQLFSMAIAAALGAGAGLLVLKLMAGAPPILRLMVGTPVIWAATGFVLLSLRPELRLEVQKLKLKSRVNGLLKRA